MIKQRDSNIELYRIIAMLLIVAHHFSLHSGMIEMANKMPSTINALFVNVFGMWGKIGINCYLMITGYYMCTSNISLRKWLKLVCWVWFYNALLNALFMASGYVEYSIHTLLRALLPISRVGSQFASTFIIFYLFIPFLNVLIKSMSKRVYQWLLLLVALVFVFLPYFPVYVISLNYLSWFVCVYFYAAYIRIHIQETTKSKQFWRIVAIICIILSVVSVVVGSCTGLWSPCYLVMDSNALLALPTAIATFMYMKHVRLGQNKIINTIAASCFGVLLIHDNSEIMHQWLWHNTLHASDLYSLPIIHLIAWSLLVVFGVYLTCTIIDMIRMYCIEKPVFKMADKHYQKYQIWYNA